MITARDFGKVVLFHRVTGDRLERWPIDAREMVATGEYTTEPPEGYVEPPAPSPPAPGIKQLPREIAPGVPANYTHRRDASPAAPMQFPTGRTKRKES